MSRTIMAPRKVTDLPVLPKVSSDKQIPFVPEICEIQDDTPSPGEPPAQPPEAPPKLNIRIAVPAYGGRVHERFMTALLNLHGALMMKGIPAQYDFLANESLVVRARNLMAASFISDPSATHLLFIDSDIELDPVLILRLIEKNADIACGCYAKKSINFDSIQQAIADGECKTATEVQRAGLDFNLNIPGSSVEVHDGWVETLDGATGIMLTKRNVIETLYALHKDTLWCKNDITTHPIREYVAIFDTFIDRTHPEFPRNLSEDFAFCRRAQGAGFKIQTDIACPTRHYGNHIFAGDIRNRFTATYSG